MLELDFWRLNGGHSGFVYIDKYNTFRFFSSLLHLIVVNFMDSGLAASNTCSKFGWSWKSKSESKFLRQMRAQDAGVFWTALWQPCGVSRRKRDGVSYFCRNKFPLSPRICWRRRRRRRRRKGIKRWKVKKEKKFKNINKNWRCLP